MYLFPRLFDNESRESLNRIAILLYLLVTPVFNLALFLLTGSGALPFLATTTALCLAGLLWLIAVPRHWRGRWIFPVSVVPVACCGLAAVAAGPAGLIFVATLTAPLAWSAILFDLGTTAVTFATTLCTFAAVVAWQAGPLRAVWGTLVLGVIEILVGWVVYGKGSNLRQAQLEALERQLNDIEITMDRAGRIVYTNAVAQATYGWGADEFLALTIQELRLADDLHNFYQQFDTVVRQGHLRFETVHRRRDATTFDVAVNSRAFTARGQVFVHSLIRDITAEKAARQALDLVNSRLLRENADKGRLLALLGHDLGNSLVAFSQLLRLTEGKKGVSQEEFFAKILPLLRESAEDSRGLLHDILAWMRSSTDLVGDPKAFSAHEVVYAAVAAAQGPAHAKGVPILVPASADVACRGNSAAVIVILRNLLVNAVKYSSAQATVSVSVGEVEGRPVFTVADHGPGIAAGRLDSLFELAPNKSTLGTAGERGSGIGLWLSREIAVNLGGSLTVHSTVGEGSVFRLTL